MDIKHSSTVVNHKASLINVKKNMLFVSKKEAVNIGPSHSSADSPPSVV